jgi:uncharacterized GH25 family protein
VKKSKGKRQIAKGENRRRISFCLLSIAICLLLSASLSASAHDYWIQPQSFVARAKGDVIVRLFVGDKLVVEEERPFQQNRTVSFTLHSLGETVDLSKQAKDGKKPLVVLQPINNGNYLITLERDATNIALEPAKFTAYLKEEGLENIIVERERLNETNSPGFERYSRFLKSLLQVGNEQDDTFKRIVGHKLEIVPQKNPYLLRKDETLPVLVLFENQPLRNSPIFSFNRSGKRVSEQATKTNDEGIATFNINRSGLWVIRLVQMRRCDNCKNADWESFWSSYTFGFKS